MVDKTLTQMGACVPHNSLRENYVGICLSEVIGSSSVFVFHGAFACFELKCVVLSSFVISNGVFFVVALLLLSLPNLLVCLRVESFYHFCFYKILTSNCSSQGNGLITRYGKGKFRKFLSHKLKVEN